MSQKSFSYPFRIGILGGGQLARMLALKAHQMGFEPHILCPDRSEPAAQTSLFWHPGDPKNIKDLILFSKKVDVITFESEFIEGSLLKELQKESQISIYPSVAHLEMLQDRLSQKQALTEAHLPTSSFMKISDAQSFAQACDYFKYKLVFKKRVGGYDGNGTFILKSKKDVEKVQADLEKINYQAIAESFVAFKRELACVFARNSMGQIMALPLVESFQEDSRCSWVIGPVQHKAWPALRKKIQGWLKKVDYLGVIAFELFDTGSQLLINETAPRVHNSGHYSMNALAVDQFELQIRCVSDLSLPKENTLLAKNFAMINLLGRNSSLVNIPKNFSGQLHWYGKKESRPGRKLGHLNFIGRDKKKLLKVGLQERKRMGL